MLVETDPELELTALGADLDDLLSVAAEGPVDVVVTDIRMPPTNTDEGVQAAGRLRDTHLRVGVVVLSQYDEPEYALKLLEGGSERRAYVLEDSLTPVNFVGAVREVARGVQ